MSRPDAIRDRLADTEWNVRQVAVEALAKLKAEYRQPQVHERIVLLLNQEKDPQVLDALFSTLLSFVAAPEIDS